RRRSGELSARTNRDVHSAVARTFVRERIPAHRRVRHRREGQRAGDDIQPDAGPRLQQAPRRRAAWLSLSAWHAAGRNTCANEIPARGGPLLASTPFHSLTSVPETPA